MRTGVAVIILAATAACGGARPVPSAAAPTGPALRSACAPPDGAAQGFRSYIIELVTSADSGDMALRDTLRLPPLRDTTAVVFETEPTVCSTVATALASAQRDSTSGGTAAYVLRVGTDRYVAWNYERVGEFFAYYVFDRRMNLVASFMS